VDENPYSNNQIFNALIHFDTETDLSKFDLTDIARKSIEDIENKKTKEVFCTDKLRHRHQRKPKKSELIEEIEVRQIKNRMNFIFIDSRCLKTIFYIAMMHTNVMIYNVDNNKIETFLQYVNQRFFANSESYIVSDYNVAINMLFIYLFIKYFCKSITINYNQNEIKNTIDKFKHFDNGVLRVDEPNYIDVEIICEYVKKIKKRTRNFNPIVREINIHKRIMLQDGLEPFPKITCDELLNELEHYSQICKVIIFKK
jgi:hypothetical protein